MTPEIRNNQAKFEASWLEALNSCIDSLSGNEAYVRTYSRLVSFQAWRSELLQEVLCASAVQFALEGQNDLLVSYLLARGGQWRSALQALRAALENYLNCLYFMDHPVEAELWANGKLRNQFSSLIDYFDKHPKHVGLTKEEYGLSIIQKEYASLSKAVHASTVSFRMSSGDETKFFSNEVSELGKWETRNRNVCRGLNLLMISLFREHLVASRKRNLRKAIALSLVADDKGWVKKKYGVTLPF